MKKLCFFNNKGGVGKTTLTANIAAYMAIKQQLKVLVVDCDPQCNITQLILGDEETIGIYWPKPGDATTGASTLLDVVRPILDGDASVNQEILPMAARKNRFRVDLMPGHPKFSMMEDPLSLNWSQIPASKPGAFRISNWLKNYLDKLDDAYDIALIDVGPSLGSINRSVLLSSDFFITPLGADVFSLLGVRNIEQWMFEWVETYKKGVLDALQKDPEIFERFKIATNVGIENGYVGYTLQQYIAKAKQGVRRPTKAFERILDNVPDEIEKSLSKFYLNKDWKHEARLGDVPNLYSLIPLAQSVNAPIFDLKSADGIVGTQYKQSMDYEKIIGKLCQNIVKNIGPL